MTSALITNIQKYSIHDGPGIRSTVFFKGCPLLCAWCHNPEDQIFSPELVWQADKCIGCGACVDICPERALKLESDGLSIDRERCVLCGTCAEACPSLALEMLGKRYTVEQLMAELDKDALFYDQSHGGVTLSGGEPLSQADFAVELLLACRKHGYHTAVDTSGYVPRSVLERVLPHTGLFLYDIKHLDDAQHQRYMGAPLGPVADNLRWLAAHGANIWPRLPIIPGINDGEEEMVAAQVLLRDCGLTEVWLLPYHKMAEAKYARMHLPYALSGLPDASEERMDELARLWQQAGFKANIGG